MRVFLKLSGELMAGTRQPTRAIDDEAVHAMASEIVKVRRDRNLELAIAVGGGNIFRGRDARGLVKLRLSTLSADYMGLLGTIINGRALADVLRSLGVETVLYSDIVDPRIARRFDPDPRVLEKIRSSGVVPIFTGMGDPGDGITTDTVAAQKAIQLGSELLLKATRVDGVYSRFPADQPDAGLLDRLDFGEFLAAGHQVMDAEAAIKCRRAGLPVRIFRFGPECLENLERALDGTVGTLLACGNPEGGRRE